MNEDERAKLCAQGGYDTIKELFEKFDKAKSDLKQEKIMQEIEELSYGVGTEKHYIITLAGGGPAVRVYGLLEDNEPATAELQYSDWGIPWTELRVDEDLLLRFAQRHYYGD